MTFRPIVGKFVDLDGFQAHVDGLVFTGWQPAFVVVHNTSSPDLAIYADWRAHPERHGNWTPEQWGRNLASYYAGMGWSSGPHAFVCPDGILLFSPFTAPGTHSPAWNSRTWGIETVGEFQTETFEGTPSQTNLVAVLGILHARLGLNPADYKFGVRGLHFHKEDPVTTHKECPGRNMAKADLIAAVTNWIETNHAGEHQPIPAPVQTAPPTATPAAPGDITDATRHSMARHILDFEARRDANGHLAVYMLPANDGGGTYEVAGINEKYDGPEAQKLRAMVTAGQFDAAETEAENYILGNTNPAMAWTDNAGVEFYLRDCVFNRGAHGAARILQHACGVSAAWHDKDDDGIVGDETRKEIAPIAPADLLNKLRAAREDYERVIVGYRANFWRGLQNRWDNALEIAKGYLS